MKLSICTLSISYILLKSWLSCCYACSAAIVTVIDTTNSNSKSTFLRGAVGFSEGLLGTLKRKDKRKLFEDGYHWSPSCISFVWNFPPFEISPVVLIILCKYTHGVEEIVRTFDWVAVVVREIGKQKLNFGCYSIFILPCLQISDQRDNKKLWVLMACPS